MTPVSLFVFTSMNSTKAWEACLILGCKFFCPPTVCSPLNPLFIARTNVRLVPLRFNLTCLFFQIIKTDRAHKIEFNSLCLVLAQPLVALSS